jgi:CubicO group peptidase (beta-lactamase class C family)
MQNWFPELAMAIMADVSASLYDQMAPPPFGFNGHYNNEQVLMSGQPSGGGVASARDLAGVLNLLASWGQYRMYQGWTAAAQVHASRSRSPSGNERPASPGLDGGHWGLGFLVAPTPRVFGTVAPGPWTVGHAGASGSVAYADPDLGLSVAFTIDGVRGRRQFLRYTQPRIVTGHIPDLSSFATRICANHQRKRGLHD